MNSRHRGIDDDVDWERAGSELLRAIRGPRSQVAFSRRLGYRSNPVADWEAGRRYPTGAELMRAAERSGLDVLGALHAFHPEAASELDMMDDTHLAAWLNAQRGVLTVQEVSERCDRSRYAVGRWLAGTTRPRVPDFLRLIEAMTGRASELVERLVPIAEVPAVAQVHARLSAVRRIAEEAPWTPAVHHALQTRAYLDQAAHRPGWLASRLGIEASEEARCLGLLEEAGLVRWGGRRYVVTCPVSPSRVSSSEDHWDRVTRARRRDAGSGDVFEGLVFSASALAFDLIRERLRQLALEVEALPAEDAEHVGLVYLSLVDLLR